MTEETCDCPIELETMEDWVQGEDPDLCRPCMLAPVAAWYKEVLEENGRQDLLEQMEKTAETLDMEDTDQALTFAKELDRIKESVEGPVRERLKGFDCLAQTFDPNEAVEQE
jgi:hypothetical protein